MSRELSGPEPEVDPPTAADFAEEAPPVPEKYQGKTAREIAEMHQNAEALIAKMSMEVGELRRNVDQQSKQLTKEQFEEQIWDSPGDAVSTLVEERIGPLERKVNAAQFRSALTAKRPDWEQVATNPEFIQMVNNSPLYREMYAKADNGGLDAALGLLEAWDNRGGKGVEKAVAQDRQKRAAVTETGSARKLTGKTYKRSEVRALKIHHPEKYEQLLPSIMEAYQDGRVLEG